MPLTVHSCMKQALLGYCETFDSSLPLDGLVSSSKTAVWKSAESPEGGRLSWVVAGQAQEQAEQLFLCTALETISISQT